MWDTVNTWDGSGLCSPCSSSHGGCPGSHNCSSLCFIKVCASESCAPRSHSRLHSFLEKGNTGQVQLLSMMFKAGPDWGVENGVVVGSWKQFPLDSWPRKRLGSREKVSSGESPERQKDLGSQKAKLLQSSEKQKRVHRSLSSKEVHHVPKAASTSATQQWPGQPQEHLSWSLRKVPKSLSTKGPRRLCWVKSEMEAWGPGSPAWRGMGSFQVILEESQWGCDLKDDLSMQISFKPHPQHSGLPSTFSVIRVQSLLVN